jgi:hypothetical protein
VCDEFKEWCRRVDGYVDVNAREYYPELLRTPAPWPYQRRQKVLLNMDHRLETHAKVIEALQAANSG